MQNPSSKIEPQDGGWIARGDENGWVFKRRFPTKWKAELALKIWQEGGRVSDYFKRIADEKKKRANLRADSFERKFQCAKQLFGPDALEKLNSETPITIRRQPGHHGAARVPLRELSDFHWRDVTGGIRRSLGHFSLFARISCRAIPEQFVEQFGHSCAHGPGPHEILVCINASDNDSTVFGSLLAVSRR